MTPNEITQSAELGLLFEALSKAQAKIEFALKDTENKFFKSHYANLSSVWQACREPLSQNGLAVIQTVEGTKDHMFLTTFLGHSSGQWMKSKLPLFNQKQDPQAVGSAITYARRYALSAIVGICADEDDDGEKAMARGQDKSKQSIQKARESKYEVSSVKDTTESEQDKQDLIIKFIAQYPVEDHEIIKSYLNRYATHWQKTIFESICDYVNHKDQGKFQRDISKYKESKIPAQTAA